MEFDPCKLDYENPDRARKKQTVVKILKKDAALSNSNLIKSADGLLSKRTVDQDVEWVGKVRRGCLITAARFHTDIVSLLINHGTSS